MGRTVAIGAQGFAWMREHDAFYVDKTGFIGEWWKGLDAVTLVCRPRRFGKTLNMDTLDCFFSDAYAGRGDLFEGLDVWADPEMRAEQGRWPVIFLSFASVKYTNYEMARKSMCRLLASACGRYRQVLLGSGRLDDDEKAAVGAITVDMDDEVATTCLNLVCSLLYRVTGRKAIVLLDEYDTPMQEAWLGGYWDEMVSFARALFNSTFKTNAWLERAIMTGVTRVSRESIFSDLNNLVVVTTTSPEYATAFGFTEDEVYASMDEMGLTDRAGVKRWYDGFTFGGVPDVYNPWSVTNYLKRGVLSPYWANSSGNRLVDQLVRQGETDLKEDFETLLNGGTVWKSFDEQVVFGELFSKPDALWSLFLANGYLKVCSGGPEDPRGYELAITNYETMRMFEGMVRGWFDRAAGRYNGFVRALLAGNVRDMNRYMNDVALETFSTFDSGTRPAESEPECFYHGFVLGLLVDLRGRYHVRSNRESGYGRYDVMLEPVEPRRDDAIVMEFKVIDPYDGERTLEDTIASAHAQMEERGYAAELVARGMPRERVREYGFAFEGKHVLAVELSPTEKIPLQGSTVTF